ncbi:MAG: sigma-70 family RNA polymerase sigma factor [Planctomycetota bacterium]
MEPTPDDTLALHAVAMQRIAAALGPSLADADDLAQDVWLAARDASPPDRATTGRWLAGVARRLAASSRRDARRREVRHERAARPERLPSAAEVAERLEVEALLVDLVRRLPEGQREVVHLRFWEGLPPRRIAERLGLGVEAVKSRQKRALAELRAHFVGADGEATDAQRRALLGMVPAGALAPVEATVAWKGAALFGGVTMKKALLLGACALAVGGAALRWNSDPTDPARGRRGGVASAPGTHEDGPEAAADDALASSVDAARSVRSAAHLADAGPAEGRVRVRGRVVDCPPLGVAGSERPAPDVEVVAGWFLSGMGGEELPRTRTASDGSFALDVPLAGLEKRLISMSAGGNDALRGAREKLAITADGPSVESVVLRRFPLGDLFGTVVDGGDAPVEGVSIHARSAEAEAVLATTDAEGRFRVAAWAGGAEIEARRAGWRDLAAPKYARKADGGGWEPVRITMVRSGALTLRILDPASRPIEGVLASVELATGEPLSSRTAHEVSKPDGDRGHSDARGKIRFESVCADHALRVRVSTGGYAPWLSRTLGDRLVAPGEEGDGFLHVEAGGHRAVDVVAAQCGVLRVRVYGIDGEHVPGAHVRLTTSVASRDEPGHYDRIENADDEGRAAFRVMSLAPLGRALLTASSEEGPFFAWRKGADPATASLELDLASPTDEEIRLDLTPTEEITGRVVDQAGNGLSAKLRVVPLDTPLHRGRLRNGFQTDIYASKNGTFRFAGLPQGHYDVEASFEEYASATVPSVEAGTADVAIELSEPRAAVLLVTADLGGAELGQLVLLTGRVRPDPGVSLEAPRLPATGRWSDFGGWPPDLVGMWYGAGGARNDGAQATYSLVPSRELSKTLRLDPGLYWLGAKARTADGDRTAPVGTGLVRVEPGQHRLTFALRTTASIEGEVRGAPQGAPLRVAVADDRGDLVWLASRRDALRPTTPLGLGGRFLLERVPVGLYELRLGTQEQLERGEAVARREVDLRIDEPRPVVFEL